MRIRLLIAAIGAVHFLAGPTFADQPLDCDAIWTSYLGVPLDDKPAIEGDEQDPFERYRIGAELFGHAYEDISARTPEDFYAAGGDQMITALRLTFGNNLMTCYMAAATDQSGGNASFVQLIEKALPPEKRSALVEQYKLPE